MARTNGLDLARLRQLARVGAEVTLNRLRGEIAAIKQAFPELANPTRRREVARRVAADTRTQNTKDVLSGKEGGFGEDEALLGRTPQNGGESGEVASCSITYGLLP